MKTDNPFAPDDHVPALEEWQDRLDCDNPDSKYWRDADYNYDNDFGTNLSGKEILFLEYTAWRQLQN